MENQPNIRALKAVVIVLGVLIVVSLIVIGATLYRRMNPPAPETATPTAPRSVVATNGEEDNGPAPPARFGDHKVELPAGARMVETRMVGERMFLRARLLGGNEVWVVLSLRTGERLGSFEIGTSE